MQMVIGRLGLAFLTIGHGGQPPHPEGPGGPVLIGFDNTEYRLGCTLVMNREDLLAHADFIQSLALRLVKDELDAADLSQQTWLTALERPAEIHRSLQGWLARVARNIKYMTHRAERHRKSREHESAPINSIPTPHEIVEKLEIRQLMMDELLRLKDPYRTTIVLRYYEGLNVKEIADHQGIPSNTVKTRLQRGLSLLRERLDARYGGNRKQWLAAMVPIAGVKLGTWQVASCGTLGSGCPSFVA